MAAVKSYVADIRAMIDEAKQEELEVGTTVHTLHLLSTIVKFTTLELYRGHLVV